jgi:hypothetical protein
MNISKFFFMLFLLIALVLHFYTSKFSSGGATSPLVSYGFMASGVLAYLFLNYIVYQVQFHREEEEEEK